MVAINAFFGTVLSSNRIWLLAFVAMALIIGSFDSPGGESRVGAMPMNSGLGHAAAVKANVEVGNCAQVSHSPAPHQLGIRAHFRPDTYTLVVDVCNFATAPLRLVRPRHTLLAQLGEWAGWRVSVTAGGMSYLPLPPPGPSIPATVDDIITLGVHQSLRVEVALAHWRKSVPGVPLMHGSFVVEETSKVFAEIAWASPPAYLRVDNVAEPTAASASR